MLFTFPGRQVNLAEKVSERLEEIVGMAKLKEQILKWTKIVKMLLFYIKKQLFYKYIFL